MKQQTSTILRQCLRKEMEKAASAAEYYPNRHIQIEQAGRATGFNRGARTVSEKKKHPAERQFQLSANKIQQSYYS